MPKTGISKSKKTPKTKEVVINACYGGFSLSPEALLWLYERGMDTEGFKTPVKEYYGDDNDKYSSLLRKDTQLDEWRKYLKSSSVDRKRSMSPTVFTPCEKYVLSGGREIPRDNPLLIECVRTLKKKADGGCASLKIVKIPYDVDWIIDEYDGSETVGEAHRSWG